MLSPTTARQAKSDRGTKITRRQIKKKAGQENTKPDTGQIEPMLSDRGVKIEKI